MRIQSMKPRVRDEQEQVEVSLSNVQKVRGFPRWFNEDRVVQCGNLCGRLLG